jgi:PAS domain S-box-containing protein
MLLLVFGWMRRSSTYVWTTRTALFLGFVLFAVGASHFVRLISASPEPDWVGDAIDLSTTAIAIAASTLLALRTYAPTLIHDRAEWAAAAQELRKSKERFDRALEGSSNGLWEWNLADDEVWIAPRFRELLGYASDAEFPSTFASWENALHPDDRERTVAALKDHLQTEGAFDVEYRLRTRSGEYRWFNARGVAIRRPDGHPYLMSGSIQDIHDRKLAEHSLRQMQEYTYQKHKMESLGELASGIAHEFNNMLQAISGQIQFAESTLAAESKAKAELAIASQLIVQASEASRRLLAFSRHGVSDPQLVSPNDVLEHLAAMLRPMIGPSIKLSIVRQEGLGQIAADVVSLQQALLNLCINARDAMPEGGCLTLSAANENLDAGADVAHPGATPGEHVVFVVSDTGCGVSDDLRKKIFEPFFTTKRRDKGTGLGLAIACGIAESHRGFIEVDTTPGEGSAFRLWIPLAPRTKKRRRPVRAAENLAAETPAARSGRITVLYAEDKKYVRRNTVRLLRERGFRVIVARDGARAVRRFRRNANLVDLALLDVSMPALDGFQVCRRLRRLNPTLPVVFCTAHAARVNAESLASQPRTYLVNKPFQPADLWRTLDDALADLAEPIESLP